MPNWQLAPWYGCFWRDLGPIRRGMWTQSKLCALRCMYSAAAPSIHYQCCRNVFQCLIILALTGSVKIYLGLHIYPDDIIVSSGLSYLALLFSKMPCFRVIGWSFSNFNWWEAGAGVRADIRIWCYAPSLVFGRLQLDVVFNSGQVWRSCVAAAFTYTRQTLFLAYFCPAFSSSRFLMIYKYRVGENI